MENIDVEKWMDKLLEFGSEYGLKVLGAILIWIIGSWVIKRVKKLLVKAMDKFDYDESLERFISNLIVGILKILLVVVILGNLGVETTSFAAILAAGGLAIGLALQGSLSNFAGGVLLLIFKPYKIGDFIEAQGEMGVVKEIEIFTTKLNTPDNKEVIIPNGALSNGNITNYSTEENRRIDITMGVSYDADIKQTKELLMKILTDNPRVLKDPAPGIFLGELADSSVNFKMRPWVLTADYWDVYFEVMEASKIELDKAGIEIPYPQMDVHKKS
ncbi:MAG: mechanosensitive ion channel protein [Flavobacteriaceae bacterium]|nr:MAG: mechanosensitive ion channel protein [Flavobacteriaceae bacterium]